MDRATLEQNRDALSEALKIAEGVTLPVTARSFTATEQKRIDWRVWGCGASMLAFLAIGIVFALADGEIALALFAGLLALVLAPAVWTANGWRKLRPEAYADPELALEVRRRDIVVTVKGKVIERLDYRAAARRTHTFRRKGAMFTGIVIDLKARPVALTDMDMKDGRAAAAAILARCVADGAFEGLR